MSVATPVTINLLHSKNNVDNAFHGAHDSFDAQHTHDLQHGIIDSEMTKNEIIYKDDSMVESNNYSK